MKIRVEYENEETYNPILFADAIIGFSMLRNFEADSPEYRAAYDDFTMTLSILNAFAGIYRPKGTELSKNAKKMLQKVSTLSGFQPDAT